MVGLVTVLQGSLLLCSIKNNILWTNYLDGAVLDYTLYICTCFFFMTTKKEAKKNISIYLCKRL